MLQRLLLDPRRRPQISRGSNPCAGQCVSFVFEEGPKGASAKNVKEEGAVATPVEEGDRELGKVKSYNEEKGFAFIVCTLILPCFLQYSWSPLICRIA